MPGKSSGAGQAAEAAKNALSSNPGKAAGAATVGAAATTTPQGKDVASRISQPAGDAVGGAGGWIPSVEPWMVLLAVAFVLLVAAVASEKN